MLWLLVILKLDVYCTWSSLDCTESYLKGPYFFHGILCAFTDLGNWSEIIFFWKTCYLHSPLHCLSDLCHFIGRDNVRKFCGDFLQGSDLYQLCLCRKNIVFSCIVFHSLRQFSSCKLNFFFGRKKNTKYALYNT